MCKSHSKKDEKGEAIVNDDKFDIVDTVKFDGEYSILKDEYLEIIETREKQLKEFEDLMNEEITIEFIKLTLEDLPEDLTEKQLEMIDFMLELE